MQVKFLPKYNKYFICNDEQLFRIAGSLFHHFIETMIQDYIQGNYEVEPPGLTITMDYEVICSFATKDELIHEMAEYLI